MSVEDDLGRVRAAAERAAWETDNTGVVGVGHDESRLVRAEVDHTGALQRLEIGARWWPEIGPDRIAQAVRTAYDAAGSAQARAWAERAEARRTTATPPAPDPIRGAGAATHGSPARDEQVEELRRALDSLRQARQELRQFRETVEDQAHRETVGRAPGDRATVAVTGGRITTVEISRRWLNEQPTGQAVADAVRDAAHRAYASVARQSAAALATMPALAAARAATADPVAVLRRLGIIE